MNRFLTPILSKSTNTNKNDWDKRIPAIEYVFNNTVSRVTDTTSMLLFGINQKRKNNDPISDYLENLQRKKRKLKRRKT